MPDPGEGKQWEGKAWDGGGTRLVWAGVDVGWYKAGDGYTVTGVPPVTVQKV